jgi:hypothetical protein
MMEDAFAFPPYVHSELHVMLAKKNRDVGRKSEAPSGENTGLRINEIKGSHLHSTELEDYV